ncbi:FG-GAP repeat protein [Nostoc sp. FACHB-892]|uniref:FG-GAP repeat protein n=1 Tax=Nostoc sp. FACHB-892 TaxID=2692843 RepID=UPI001F54EF35|nr:FG-GAP repeat protein [Nostoc sp. FACHB-892]
MAPNSAVFELSDLDGNNGFAIIGSSFLSGSDSSAGDINGDGFDDLIIGALGQVVRPPTDSQVQERAT